MIPSTSRAEARRRLKPAPRAAGFCPMSYSLATEGVQSVNRSLRSFAPTVTARNQCGLLASRDRSEAQGAMVSDNIPAGFLA